MSEQPTADGTNRARLQSDRPIKSEAEDVLGFSGFANALALSLTEMAPEDGLVISVEGEWGSGKTSAIELTHRRLILRELARETSKDLSEIEKNEWAETQNDWEKLIDTRRTHVIRFNPWNFSGQENLTRAFFGELGSVIGHPPNGPIAKAVHRVRELLPTAGALVGASVGAAAGTIIGAGAGLSAGRAIGEGTKTFFGESDSLEKAKHELAEALSRSGKRIIVIIDDLDRLL